MKDASIGAWLDRSLSGTTRSWRGSEAKKIVDQIMQKSIQCAGGSADTVTLGSSESKPAPNFQHYMRKFDAPSTEEAQPKAAENTPREEKAQEKRALDTPFNKNTISNTKPFEQLDGWNIA